MGKVVGTILETAAVVAVQAIPGVGQAVGAALGVSAKLGAAIATVAVVGAEAGLNAALSGSAARPETTETAIKSALAPRVDAFGISRLPAACEVFP